MKTTITCTLLTVAAILMCSWLIVDKIERTNEHNERFEALVMDSIRTHKMLDNYHLNYNTLKKLEE